MTGISVEAGIRGKWTTLLINGPLNSYSYNELQNKLNELTGQCDIAVDFSGVTSMTSAGIGVILAALEDSEAAEKRFCLVALSEVVRLAIESTGFAERFTVISSLKDLPL